jgi:hypothetical protein
MPWKQRAQLAAGLLTVTERMPGNLNPDDWRSASVFQCVKAAGYV